MNDDIAIKVENLSKIYKLYDKPIDRLKESLHWGGKKYHKDFYALNDISFEIKKGETVGIIGKNGSGKSTLLKIITGVLTQTSGNVKVNGKVSALLELGAGFNPEYTGIENIYFQGNLMGYTEEEVDSKLQDILDFADIGEFINQPVKMYSSGMFARLAFAVAINVEPDILIVDEALSVGDVKFVFKCLNKLKNMQESGATIILVTHDIQTVKTFCCRGIWIKNGNLLNVGSVEVVTNAYIRDLFQDDASRLNEFIQPGKVKTNIILDDDSVNYINDGHIRWGSGEVLIENFQFGNLDKFGLNYINYLDEIRIVFTAIVKKYGFYPHLSFAFSIRNIKNLDVIANVLKHNSSGNFGEHEKLTVEFSFLNILPPGEYMLILAIENRNGHITDYVDYIENALTFKVLSDSIEFYSIVKPVIKSSLLVE